jgi:polyisoprenoid-binding protein YceI
VSGDLTMHGVTKPVELDVEAPGTTIKGMMGEIRSGAHATTRVNRKDFGIVWNKTLDGGGVAVGDDVDVSIDVEGVKKVAAGG